MPFPYVELELIKAPAVVALAVETEVGCFVGKVSNPLGDVAVLTAATVVVPGVLLVVALVFTEFRNGGNSVAANALVPATVVELPEFSLATTAAGRKYGWNFVAPGASKYFPWC